MTVLWVSMGLHIGAFLWWLLASYITHRKLTTDYAERTAHLDAVYDQAKDELQANIENVKAMAHEYNQALINKMMEGR